MDKKCWLSLWATKPFTGNELCDYLLETENRIIVISGLSGSGKTSIINKLKKDSGKVVNAVAYTFLTNYICRYMSSEPVTQDEFDMKTLCHIFCVEDVDFLAGKDSTQEAVGELLREVSKGCKVIITGIELRKTVPELLKALGGYEEIVYIYI